MALQDKIDLDGLIEDILGDSLEKEPAKPFWAVCATLIQFSIEEIKDRCKREFNYQLIAEDESSLMEASFQNRKTGRYSLRDYRRREILKRLTSQGEIAAFVQEVPGSSQDENQDLFNAILTDKHPEIHQLSLSQLVMLARIADWVAGTKISLPPKSEINSLIKREELLRPFRKLTENFQGRQKRLDQITQYVDWLPQRTLLGKAEQFIRRTISWFEKPPMLISGIGGIGKSTLIAKFILQHAEHDAARKIPFIYLDFDRPGLSISEPMQLAAEGMRQLRVQFPEQAGLFDDIRRDILTYLDRGESRGTPSKKGPSRKASGRGIILEAIHRQYLSRFEKDISRINNPVLVVLDSFEEAQYRATFSELNNLFQFLQEVAEAVPRFRPVIIGRSDLVVTSFSFEKMYLETFDEEAARGYLKALGVDDASVARQIARKLGGNPLTLQLAAQIVKQDADSQREISSVKTRELFSRIDEKRIQGQLVRRNLDHIHDDEVRKMAVPGMLVRKINPEVIQHILAEPCGLGKIDKDQADAIFERLQKETFLLEESMGSLTFRQDLRVALYDLIVKEDWEKAFAIHDHAIKFYEDAKTPADKSEYLYHILKKEENPYVIDQYFTEDMRPHLEPSLTEFHLAVYMKFATKLGITVAEEVLQNAPARELEGYFNFQIDDAINNGDEESLHEIERLLKKYPQRMEPSSMLYHEAKLHFRLGNERQAQQLISLMKSIWPSDVRVKILAAQWYEFHRDYEKALHELENTMPDQEDEMPFISQRVEILIALTLLNFRKVKTDAENSFNLSASFTLSDPFWKRADSLSQDTLIAFDIPKPYRFKNHNLPKPLGNKKEEIKRRDFEIFMEEITEKALPAEFFHQLHDRLKEVFSTKGEIEQFLFNRYNLQLSDISEAGIFELNLLDLAKFLEQRDQKEYDDLLSEEEGTPADSSPPDDFFNIDALIQEIKDALEAFEYEKAFRLAHKLTSSVNPELENDLKLLEGRYNQIGGEVERNYISVEEAGVSLNRVVSDFLDLLDKLGI